MTEARIQLRDEVLDEFEVFRGKERTVELLSGGLTNHNFKVTTPDGCYVVRLSPDDTSALAIDRDNEHVNSVRAAAAGVGAPVIDYAPQHHILIVGYLDGETFTEENFTVDGTIPRVADAVRRLHAAEPFDRDFDMFRIQPRYLSIVERNGYRLPSGYRDFAEHVARIEQALADDPAPFVPCNNDLLAGNFIDYDGRIWLIDYEYSGNNDPCFELGNIWSECKLDADQLDELVTCYYGEPMPHKVARAELQGLVSRYGWTLWGSIQDATSEIDFDFWEWAMERYDAAASVFTSPRFEHLLGRVRREEDA